jgi:hypothetical protein
MASEYGNKLDPYRELRTSRGIKGERRTFYVGHTPSTITPGVELEVRFPDLGKNDVIVPGTSKLSFKIDLTSATDANRSIVNNLGRAIVSKIVVNLEGREVYSLAGSDIFGCYQDLWKTTKERKNSAYQGIQSEAARRNRIDAGNAGAAATDVAIGTAYGNLFSIPLDFEMLESHTPFFQSSLKDKLSYVLTFNDFGKVIVSSDTTASYTISKIALEFEVFTNTDLATTLRSRQMGKTRVLYDRVHRHALMSNINKSDTSWTVDISTNAISFKGILILFIDPADGGTDYARDSEKFYNPKIKEVSVTVSGQPNQIYATFMRPHQHFDEIRKIFADGKHRTVPHTSKELELSDIDEESYLTTKYGLWLDMRSTDDDTLHGSGRQFGGTNQDIKILMERDSETAGALKAYVYTIQDGVLYFEDGRFTKKSIVFESK